MYFYRKYYTMKNIPEYIEGIPTDKMFSRERKMIIKNEYIRLIERLQNTKGKKAVFNESLQVEVFIIMRESEKKASNNASIWAVKHLETIIREAVPKKGEPIYTLPKSSGKQKEFGYVNIATLYYECRSDDRDYMNFRIKLVLGIKSEGRHVQYSVNKIEIA